MMRRRVFLDQDFITASRDFVCVRMNAWLDEVAADPEQHLPAEYVSFDFAPSRWTA